HAISGFNYDAATKTGVWTLGSAIANDKVRLFLDDALVTGLDGEWADSTDTFPSGDGTAGGDFAFRLNVLRGDATQDGQVNALDLSFIKQRLNKTATNPGTTGAVYSVFADLTDDGSINALDLSAAKQRLRLSLDRRVLPHPFHRQVAPTRPPRGQWRPIPANRHLSRFLTDSTPAVSNSEPTQDQPQPARRGRLACPEPVEGPLARWLR